jgi:DNA polymerase IV
LPALAQTRRYLCLYIPHFASRLETILAPTDISQQPICVLRTWDDGVLDASPMAEAFGIAPGDSQRRAKQLCPNAHFIQARDDFYNAHHDALHAVVADFAKAVEISALGEYFIEIGDLARTFNNERELAHLLITQLEQISLLVPVVGIASNKHVAEQAALKAAEPESKSRVVVVPPGTERGFLASMPLTAIPRLPAEVERRLHLFGIHTLGEFAAIPRIAAIEQFGRDIAVFYDLAKGIDPRGLTTQAPPPTLTKTITFPDPVKNLGLVLIAMERAARRMGADLQARGYQTTALSTNILTTRTELHTGTSIKPPTADIEILKRTVGRMLNKLEFNSEIVGLTLTSYPLQDWAKSAQQLSLFDEPPNPKLDRLLEEIRKLQVRFGDAIMRMASTLVSPVPIPIKVKANAEGAPQILGWGKFKRIVVLQHNQWRRRGRRWDTTKAFHRQYYLVECTGGLIFLVFRDDKGNWFLDRRRVLDK